MTALSIRLWTREPGPQHVTAALGRYEDLRSMHNGRLVYINPLSSLLGFKFHLV